MRRKILILTESQVIRITDELIKEQENKVYTDFDRIWDYKFENGMWFTRKKGAEKWISLKNYPEAITKLNARYGTSTPVQKSEPINYNSPAADMDYSKPKQTKTEKNPIEKPETKLAPINYNSPEADMDYSKPKQTKTEKSPDIEQSTPSVDKLYTGADPNLASKINLDKLSPTDTTHVCNADTENCAQFVNNFSTKISGVGNAWEAYENGGVGKPLFSAFKNLTDKQVQSYYDIYQEVMGKKQPVNTETKIKRLEEELINQNGQPDPKTLQLGDVVGLYYPPSSHHIDAFKGSATYRNFYPEGQIGKTIGTKRIGHTFNTHVGIVGAIKNGVPLIFHNIKGKVYSDPPRKLKIAWAKRP